MAAIVPCSLINFYKQQNLVGGIFSLEYFQCEGTYYEYPIYEEYSFVRDEIVIKISENTKLIPLTSDVERGFAFYPSVTSIKPIFEDRTMRKMLIGNFFLKLSYQILTYNLNLYLNIIVLDVVGKIIMGGRVTYVRDDGIFRLDSWELFLQDGT